MAEEKTKAKKKSIYKEKKSAKKLTKTEKKALRKKKFRRGVLIAVSILLLICVGVGFAGYRLLDSLQPAINSYTGGNYVNDKDLISSSDVRNILLIGVDTRSGKIGDVNKSIGRSDVMMLVSLNKKTKTTTMVSFQRDTWVEIPGNGSAKINAATNWGGVPLLIDTLEYNFRIKIDQYVLVTFEPFKKAVDAMDGVSVPITEKDAKEMKTYSKGKISVPAGDSVLLNGDEALLYVRVRKQDDDWMRAGRQRTLLKALTEKAKSNPIKAFQAMQSVLPEFKTDMSGKDIAKIFGSAPGLLKYDVKQESIPYGPSGGSWRYEYINTQAAIKADIPKNRDYLKELLYGE
ncbi:MAG: LCP family protein [Oscillospiraceae bacterium]|nr:LCP family protein [Oscillospiraceae bacterium]